MFGRRLSSIGVGPGTDEVMWGISLPSDTVVHRVSGEVHISGPNQKITTIQMMYGVRAAVLPILDPDAAANFQVLWDQLIPKDTDVQAIDLDTSATDATPFFEPGEADWSKVLDIGMRPKVVYDKTKVLSAMSPHSFRFQDNQTPFLPVWSAGDMFTFNFKSFRVRQPSALVMAFASPSLDDTIATVEAALAENEWAQVKYAEETLERAMLDLLGLTEAGATTPFEEATDVLQKHLLPDVHEETAADWGTESYHVASRALIDHSVTGRLAIKSLSLGSG